MKKSGTLLLVDTFPKHISYFPMAKNVNHLFCTLDYISSIFLKHLLRMLFFFFFFVFLSLLLLLLLFLGPLPRHMEVPRLGVQSEL